MHFDVCKLIAKYNIYI